jgi:hypothetical protein
MCLRHSFQFGIQHGHTYVLFGNSVNNTLTSFQCLTYLGQQILRLHYQRCNLIAYYHTLVARHETWIDY